MPSQRYASTAAGLSQSVLERKGCPLHYWMGGPRDAPLVALMHGATMDHRMFNDQVPALIDTYRVLVWDSRGHGLSQPVGIEFSLEDAADDMLAILDQEGIDKAILVGQSLGGFIAQHVYLKAPERVLGIGVIGSLNIAQPYSALEVAALKLSLPILRWWPYKNFVNLVAQRTTLDDEVRPYVREAIKLVGPDGFAAIWTGVTLGVTTEGLPGHSIDVPLLITHGDQDRTGTISRDAPKWAAKVREEGKTPLRYEVIPDAAHNANQDNPAFTNRILLAWLGEHFPT
ncbi:MAG: alpha/beta hydrolase [Chloroflexi bacterium]|nr:alpha/beta hydrolase [Chloroflexota bacterium]